MEEILIAIMLMCKDVTGSELKCQDMYLSCVKNLNDDKYYTLDSQDQCTKIMLDVVWDKKKRSCAYGR